MKDEEGIPIADLTAKIDTVLKEYTDAVIDGTKQDVKAVAEECKENIGRDSPRGNRKTKKYADSWKVKYEENALEASATVYNTQYQLTHLLENGHATRNGGRTRAFPHIKPNEEKANAELEKRIEMRVANEH